MSKEREASRSALFSGILTKIYLANYSDAEDNIKTLQNGSTKEEFKSLLHSKNDRVWINNKLLAAIFFGSGNKDNGPMADPLLQNRIKITTLLLDKGLEPCEGDIERLPVVREIIEAREIKYKSLMTSDVKNEFLSYSNQVSGIIQEEVRSVNSAISGLRIRSLPQDGDVNSMKERAWINYCKSDVFKKGMILHSKILSNNLDQFKTCIELGVNIRAQNQHKQTILEFAIWHNMPEVVEILLEVGIGINEVNSRGQTPLHIAASQEEEINKITELLLSKGADANAKDRNGATPLHLAAKSNSVQNLALLLDHGADINATDNKGMTALDYTLTFAKADGRGNDDYAGDHRYIMDEYFAKIISHSPSSFEFLASSEAIKFLLENGASITQSCKYGDYIQDYLKYYSSEVASLFGFVELDRDLVAVSKKARWEYKVINNYIENHNNAYEVRLDIPGRDDTDDTLLHDYYRVLEECDGYESEDESVCSLELEFAGNESPLMPGSV